jgi:hypothetical protein
MLDETPESSPRYRIISIRPDRSRVTLIGGLTLDEAKLTGKVIEEAHIFDSLYIEPDEPSA